MPPQDMDVPRPTLLRYAGSAMCCRESWLSRRRSDAPRDAFNLIFFYYDTLPAEVRDARMPNRHFSASNTLHLWSPRYDDTYRD